MGRRLDRWGEVGEENAAGVVGGGGIVGVY